MQRAAAQRGVVFPNLQLFGLELLVPRGGVTGGRFAFLARFSAFDGDDFAGHVILSPWRVSPPSLPLRPTLHRCWYQRCPTGLNASGARPLPFPTGFAPQR